MYYDDKFTLQDLEVEFTDYFSNHSGVESITKDEIDVVVTYARSMFFFLKNADNHIAKDTKKPKRRYDDKIKIIDEMFKDGIIDDSQYKKMKDKIDRLFGRTRNDFLLWTKRGFDEELRNLRISDTRIIKLKASANRAVNLYTK